MANVINLNRFRKKKAKLEKERRAETNRRLHGRNTQERAQEDAVKKRIEDKLDGAFLIRESVAMDDIPGGIASDDFDLLEDAASRAIPINELAKRMGARENDSPLGSTSVNSLKPQPAPHCSTKESEPVE